MTIYREIYATLVTKRVPESFTRRFIETNDHYHSLTIVSPWIDLLEKSRYPLKRILEKINKKTIRTFVITRKPEESWHQKAIDLLLTSDFVEMNFNNDLHAKFYVCECNPYSYALLSTANLTSSGIEGYEAGMMIEGRGGGEPIVVQLRDLGQVILRLMKGTKRVRDFSKRR